MTKGQMTTPKDTVVPRDLDKHKSWHQDLHSMSVLTPQHTLRKELVEDVSVGGKWHWVFFLDWLIIICLEYTSCEIEA